MVAAAFFNDDLVGWNFVAVRPVVDNRRKKVLIKKLKVFELDIALQEFHDSLSYDELSETAYAKEVEKLVQGITKKAGGVNETVDRD